MFQTPYKAEQNTGGQEVLPPVGTLSTHPEFYLGSLLIFWLYIKAKKNQD